MLKDFINEAVEIKKQLKARVEARDVLTYHSKIEVEDFISQNELEEILFSSGTNPEIPVPNAQVHIRMSLTHFCALGRALELPTDAVKVEPPF